MKQEVSIRKALPKDVDTIAGLNTKLLQHHLQFERQLYALASPKKREKAMKKKAKQRIYSKNSLALIAEANGKIVGYLTASIKTKPEYFKVNKVGHIHQLFVKPAFRKKGLGKALFKEAEKFFKQKGAEWMEVEASVKNLPTKETYKALGLREFETIMIGKVQNEQIRQIV